MEKIKLTKISVEQLRTLSERGGFYISVEETRLRKLIKDLKIKKYWGPPRPFYGANDLPLEVDHLYIWLRDRDSMTIYATLKYKPNICEKILDIYPSLLTHIRAISPSEQKNILEQIANILDPQKQWCIALVKWRCPIFTLSLMLKILERKEKMRHILKYFFN